MRKSFVALAAFAALTLLVGTASAQWPRPGDDILGIYSNNDGMTGLANRDVAAGSATIYLIAANVTGSGGVSGWECHLTGDWDANPNIFFGGESLSGQPLNVSAFPDYSVGLGAPLPADGNGNVVLANWTFIFFGPETMLLYLGPANAASHPGTPLYAAGDDPGHLIDFTVSSGEISRACFGFNSGPLTHLDGGPIPVTQETFGAVKNMYR
jgi:hypothetical protein